jgi:hypothetical protein
LGKYPNRLEILAQALAQNGRFSGISCTHLPDCCNHYWHDCGLSGKVTLAWSKLWLDLM